MAKKTALLLALLLATGDLLHDGPALGWLALSEGLRISEFIQIVYWGKENHGTP